jgi:hypothetical protein
MIVHASSSMHVGVAVGDLRRELRIGAETHHPLRPPADLRTSRRADDDGVVVRAGDRVRHGVSPKTTLHRPSLRRRFQARLL